MTEQKKFYLTQEGFDKLKKEREFLKALKLSKTKGEEAPKILHSEEINPDYLTFREGMTFLEMRIAEVENILKNVQLLDVPPKENQDIVQIGATITVEIDGAEQDEFKLVGTLEANPSLGRISNESPVGKVLVGLKVGQEAVVSSPIKTIYRIKKIKYEKM